MDKFLQESLQSQCELMKQNCKVHFNEELFTQVNIFKYAYYNYGSLREYLFRQLPNLTKYGITDIILEPSHTWRGAEHENHLYQRIGVHGMSLVKMENPTSDDCINAIQKCFDQNPGAKVAVLSKQELSDLPDRLKARNFSTTVFSVEGGDTSAYNRLRKPAQMARLQYHDFWLDIRSPRKEPDAPGVPKDLTQSDSGADLEAKDVRIDSGNPEESNAPDVPLRTESKRLWIDQRKNEIVWPAIDVLIHMEQCDLSVSGTLWRGLTSLDTVRHELGIVPR